MTRCSSLRSFHLHDRIDDSHGCCACPQSDATGGFGGEIHGPGVDEIVHGKTDEIVDAEVQAEVQSAARSRHPSRSHPVPS